MRKNLVVASIITSVIWTAFASMAMPSTAFADTVNTCPAGAWVGTDGTSSYYLDTSGNHVTCQVSQSSNAQCHFYDPESWIPNCFFVPGMSAIGAIFIALGAAFLQIIGYLFDALIQNFIINFYGSLQSTGAYTAVTLGWTIFRDLANIVIIGLFTFIAINIILGNQEFGQKKLIANVLIVAVLLNFSLLFTKLIIDASNFTAYQFYQQITTSNGSSNSINQASDGSIAGGFMKAMGMKSFSDDTGALLKTFTDNQQKNGSSAASTGFQALFYGIISGLLLFILGLVLLYGCFLIFARGLLLVFLMLTSAIAFATYLIPSLSKNAYGLSGWWRSLINAAIFAPLLMIFLFITNLIMNAGTSAAGKTINLGNVVANPSQIGGSGWSTILLYILGTGMLFISFKVSSSFATAAGGLNWAAAPIAVANRLGVAPVLRNTIGRSAVSRESANIKGREEARVKLADLGVQLRKFDQIPVQSRTAEQSREFERLTAEHTQAKRSFETHDRRAQQAGSLAGSSFNIMNTSGGKWLAKQTGVKNVSDAKPTSFKAQAKVTADAAAKEGEKMVMSKTEVDKVRTDKAADLRTANPERANQENIAREASAGLETLRGDIKKQYAAEQLEERLKDAKKEETDATLETASINEKQRSGQIDAAEHDRQLRTQKDRIERAQQTINDTQTRMKTIDQPYDAQISQFKKTKEAAEAEIKRIDKQIDAEADAYAKSFSDQSKEGGAQRAEQTAHRRGSNLLYRAFGNRVENDRVAKMARDAMKSKISSSSSREKENLLKTFESIQKQAEDGEKAPPPAKS